MSEKFKIVGNFLYQEGERIGSINDSKTLRIIEKTLNQQEEEISFSLSYIQKLVKFLVSKGFSPKDVIEFSKKEE